MFSWVGPNVIRADRSEQENDREHERLNAGMVIVLI